MPEDENEDRKKVIHIRVAADELLAETVATLIGELLEEQGYELIEQSVPIPSRFDDCERRIFLTVR